MKSLTIFVALLIVGSISSGQIPVGEANQRLHEKQAEHDAARSRPVTITQGELDDMKSELLKLRAELQQLRREALPPAGQQPAASKLPAKIAVGMTREQLLRFVKVHKDKLEITSDLPTASVPARDGQKLATMTVAVKAPHDVVVGTHSNGGSQSRDVVSELRPDSTLTLVLVDDVVASLSDEKLPQ